MRVFVTGASGFVGGHLVPQLEAQGCEVRAVGMELEISDRRQLEQALSDAPPSVIVHLAAQSSVAASWGDPAECFRTNTLGTLALLRAAATRCPDARILLVSSGDTYGSAQPSDHPYRENDPLRPASPYARSKVAADLMGALAAKRGQDVVRIRAFTHTGAGQTDRFVASSFARQLVVMELGSREPVLRVGNLASLRDFLDVEDVVGAYLKLMEPNVPPGAYNVASGRGIRIQSVLDQLVELSKVDPAVEVDPERFRETDQLVGDARKLEDATGWQPRIPLRTTLTNLIADWRTRLA
jgi:GDP-4-dehydro-6-deoxy-D-mannose reductase